MQVVRFPLKFVRRALMASLDEIWYFAQEDKRRPCREVGRYLTSRGLSSPTIAQGLEPFASRRAGAL